MHHSEIEIIIGADGTVDMHVINGEGAECEKLLKPFEEAFGKIARQERKPEFYREPARNRKRQTL